ncbi:sensor histidine kinase [Sinomicrobium sp.]
MTYKLRWLLVLCCLFGITQGIGQSKEELQQHSDSLYTQLKQIEGEEERAEALLDLSLFWSDYDVDNALHYIDEAKALLGGKGETSYYRGLFAYSRGSAYFDADLPKAKKAYMEAVRYLEKAAPEKQDKALRYSIRSWASYGSLLQRENRANEFVEILLNKVIPLAEQTGDSTLLGSNYQNLAINLMNKEEYEKADQYFQKALSFLEGRPEAAKFRLELFVNWAQNALFVKDYPRTKAILDSAFVVVKNHPHLYYVPMYHSVSGSYNVAIGNYEDAYRHFEKGLIAAKSQVNEDMEASILFEQFSVYESNGRYKEALESLRKVLHYVQKRSSLKNKKMVYQNLASVTTKLGRYQEAIEWYEAYNAVSDSLYKDESKNEILELEIKYHTARQEQELLKIKNENQEQELSLQKVRTIAIVFASAFILLVVVGLAWYRAQKSKRILLEQKELLLEQELKNHRQQEKLSLYNAMLQGEERERTRMARDLHDGLGGMLANVKMKLSAVTNDIDEHENDTTSAADLHIIINQLDKSVNELRRVARNLMPESLLYMGLEAALGDLCKGMTHPGMAVDFQSSGLHRDYTQPFMITVYRVVQELLANALKHSEATQVWVQCSEENGELRISVEDNGKGFDQKKMFASGKEGIGLSNIRNRIALLNGCLEVDTTVGKGSSFHILIKTDG